MKDKKELIFLFDIKPEILIKKLNENKKNLIEQKEKEKKILLQNKIKENY